MLLEQPTEGAGHGDANDSVKSEPTALESLIMLTVVQCKHHIAANNTKDILQWAVMSGLNKDIIQGWGTNTNLKMRMVIARYALHIFYTQLTNKSIKYVHIGIDNQHMSFNQKWMNIFVRYCVNGRPLSMTLGVQRVFGGSTGENIFNLVKGLVTGDHLNDRIQTGSTLHGNDDDDEEDEDGEGSGWKSLIDKLKEAGIKTGMPWEEFLTALVSNSSDAGSDFFGRVSGFRGRLQQSAVYMLNSYWCCNHKFDLNTKDLAAATDVEVFR